MRDFNILDIAGDMESCIEVFSRARSSLSCEAHDYDDGNGAEKDEQEDILNDMIYKDQQKIYIISHRPEIKQEMFNDVITVVKENDVSKIIVR